MKKTLLLSLACAGFVFLAFGVFFWRSQAAQNVSVSATVGNVNAAPVVLSVTPSSSPIAISVNGTQNVSLKIKDAEGDPISYTITTPYGGVSPSSGTITDSAALMAGTAYINFLHVAPATAPGAVYKVSVVLNDGPNLVTKTISFYAY